MQKTDLKEFSVIMKAINESFVGKNSVSVGLVETYFRVLEYYEMSEVKMAANIIMGTWKNHWLPKPAHFIEIIEGDSGDNALEQWEYVLSELSRVGVTRAYFDEATTRAINSCGGVEVIGHCDKSKLTFLCKDFCANYKVIAKREQFKQIENKDLKELTNGLANKLSM